MKFGAARSRSNLANNAVANVVQMLVGSLLLFALYRYINAKLGIAQLGVWSVVVATVSASRLADLGLSAGITRFVARDRGDGNAERAAKVVDTALLTLMVTVGLLLPLAYFLASKALPLFFETKHLEQAKGILPLALASLWLTMVGSVFQGGLEGCQRMELRAALVITGQLFLLLLAIWLVPTHGLTGLAMAQIGQGIVLVIGGRLLLRSVMPRLPLLPLRWDGPVLREMFRYGANLQASTLFILLFDPTAKALMARFGGASSAGYFEMANQVVMRARSVIVAANQAIVPHIAGLSGADRETLRRFYRGNLRILVAVTLPAVALLMAGNPVASWALVKSYQPQFSIDLLVLSLVWGLNILASPAYFINQGTGHVGTNTLTHLVSGVVSTTLGLFLGWRLGANGVLAGYGAGLVAGTCWQIAAFGRRYELSALEAADWKEHGWLLSACLIIAAWAVLMLLHQQFARISIASAGFGIALALLAAAIWTHKLRKELHVRIPASTKVQPS